MAVAYLPGLAILLAIVLVASLAISRSWLRIGGTVLLALEAFGSSASLNAPKMAFIALVPVITALAIYQARSSEAINRLVQEHPRVVRNANTAFMLWGIYTAFSVGHSLVSGFTPSSILRDAVPYITWSLVYVWARDLSAAEPQIVARMTLIVSAIAAAGMGTTWVSRRGGANLPEVVQLFPSFSLSVLGICLAAALIVANGFALLPAICLLVATSGLILSGTRTFLIVPVSLLGLLVGWRKFGIKGFFGLIALVVTVIGAAMIFPHVAGAIGVDPEFLANRNVALTRVLDNGVSSDASGEGRLASYQQAVQVFQEKPLIGQGPGYVFTASGGGDALGLDTPLTFPAKFGIFGVVLLVYLVGAIGFLVRSLSRSSSQEWKLAAYCFGLCQLLYLPFGGAFDDKGLGLACVLLLGGLISSSTIGRADGDGSSIEDERLDAGNAVPGRTGQLLPVAGRLYAVGHEKSQSSFQDQHLT